MRLRSSVLRTSQWPAPSGGQKLKRQQRILGIESIGIHDNFFELGGHSLYATQVISRLCGAFELEVPLKVTLVLLTKLVPVIVTLAPAAADEGEILVIVGGRVIPM